MIDPLAAIQNLLSLWLYTTNEKTAFLVLLAKIVHIVVLYNSLIVVQGLKLYSSE